MLADLLNLVGVRPSPAPTEGGGHVEPPAPQKAAAAATATAAQVAAASEGGRGAQGDDVVAGVSEAQGLSAEDRSVVRWVDDEYRRAQGGGWRRLFPSERSAEFLPFLAPERQLHALPFAMARGGER